MKRLAALFFFMIFCQILIAGENEKFRATWVITWEHINSGWSAEQNKALARQILDNHKKANMNAVLWQCRQSGTAYYNSSYEPWGYYAGNKYPGYDPLAYAVEEAHKRGLELHAWFNVFHTSSTEPGTPAAEHPEWICRDQDGIPMTSSRAVSPGLAAVREYTLKVAMEIVRNYDIDGLHLDYVRWNEYSNSKQSQAFAKVASQQHFLDGQITDEQIQDLEENRSGRYLYDIEHPYSAGIPDSVGGGQFHSWEDWWRWSVTEFVRTLHDSIQAVKPWVRLSAAALGKYRWSGWQGYGTVYQDAALWFNEGYVDQLTPMHYHWTTGSGFYDMLVNGGTESWGYYIQPGINDGRLYSAGPGSYALAEQKAWGRHPDIVETVRTIPWVDGFQFFSYGDWDAYKYWEKAKTIFFNRLTKIRATKLIVDSTPDAPSITMAKLDTLNYEITVTHPAAVITNHWFAIYRSIDDTYDVETDEIVDIHFGNSSYSFTDEFTGTQDYNGSYNYFATVLDRYWNESEISNSEQTDPIFSAAPTVISTTPTEGDTILVNSDVTIFFSKTIDINSISNAVSFNPARTISQLVWLNNDKTLTIILDGNFEYETAYTMTIAASITDINGKQLDGNGDGTAGDAFSLHLITEAADTYGPTIVTSNPDYLSYTDTFIFDEVITFLFDEVIDPVTANDNSVKLSQGDDFHSIHYKITDVRDKSILSIQSLDTLKHNTDYSMLLTNEISDTAGNNMDSDVTVSFKTSPIIYEKNILIDKFLSTSNWEQPTYSGSTVGIYAPNTSFGMSANTYLPSSTTRQRTSAVLNYEWDLSASTFLLREYCSGSSVRSIEFDTSYVLQCFVFGDGSYNKFRFCIDEAHGGDWPDHEVSKWFTIDWYGWRLLEWRLNDPHSVGEWIGNSVLDGTAYRIDSFQLTHEEGAAVSGAIYFDILRLVKKSLDYLGIEDKHPRVTSTFALFQNYPNPFNPETIIRFTLSTNGLVILKVYNILGNEVATLVNKTMPQGNYEVLFDGSNLPSGTYFYRLECNGNILKKRMLLLK